MFDWNDEELTNIIWGEAGEGEDHIVPYPDDSQEKPSDLYGDHIKKEQSQEDVDAKSSEQKKSIPQTDLRGLKLEGNSQYVANEGLDAIEFSVDSWPNLSLPSTAEAEQDLLDTEGSNVTEISKHESRSEDKAAPLDNASEIFQSRLEHSEQGDFVDYSWATVGSFEDLDRIFSNDDLIFGHASLGNADELWSSSKDVTSSPEKPLPLSVDSPSMGIRALKSTTEQFQVKAEYLSDQNQSFGPGYEKLNLFASNTSRDNHSCVENIQYAGGKNELSMKQKTAMEMVGNSPAFNLPIEARNMTATNENIDKGKRQKKKLKGLKKLEEKSEVRHLQDFHGSWTYNGNQFIPHDGQFTPAVGQPGSSVVFGQHLQYQVPESSQYKNFSSPMTSLVHGNMAKQYSQLPVLSQFPSGEGGLQPVPPCYEVSSGNLSNMNKSAEAPATSMAMTPQEKIEKLRRRQQMRAMLAIQKQQQQFGNQVSSTEYSVMEGENTEAEEILSTLPSLDPNSPIEQDDSNTVYVGPDDCPVHDSILHRLQEIIAKLDVRIRLCIRDSLFRLAQSATQRQYAGDSSSSNKCSEDEFLTRDETKSHKRFPKAPAVETETNPIDRTVAHLLFHRPLELSGKPVETPDSPLSAKILPYERKATGPMSLPTNFLPQSSEKKQIPSHDESKVPCLFADEDQVKNSPHLDASENSRPNKITVDGASKFEPPSGG